MNIHQPEHSNGALDDFVEPEGTTPDGEGIDGDIQHHSTSVGLPMLRRIEQQLSNFPYDSSLRSSRKEAIALLDKQGWALSEEGNWQRRVMPHCPPALSPQGPQEEKPLNLLSDFFLRSGFTFQQLEGITNRWGIELDGNAIKYFPAHGGNMEVESIKAPERIVKAIEDICGQPLPFAEGHEQLKRRGFYQRSLHLLGDYTQIYSLSGGGYNLIAVVSQIGKTKPEKSEGHSTSALVRITPPGLVNYLHHWMMLNPSQISAASSENGLRLNYFMGPPVAALMEICGDPVPPEKRAGILDEAGYKPHEQADSVFNLMPQQTSVYETRQGNQRLIIGEDGSTLFVRLMHK
ncbi:hypothetical protein HYU13_04095 [Candidatus Woesearchaeota archaeon]|nr:hypothetical protein [Candidatus Woesearchaeota archaeon]